MALAENKAPSYVPTRDEITQRARDLIPELKERARAEDLRQMPEENVKALKDAGIHKIFTPKDMEDMKWIGGTQVDVARNLEKDVHRHHGCHQWSCLIHGTLGDFLQKPRRNSGRVVPMQSSQPHLLAVEK